MVSMSSKKFLASIFQLSQHVVNHGGLVYGFLFSVLGTMNVWLYNIVD